MTPKKEFTIDSKERVMRDSEGRHTIFHGVNVVYKIPPYIPDSQVYDSQNSLNDKDIDDLVSWGFNFVRLGVMWEAVETSPGNFNSTYIQEVDTLINKLGAK
jgi:endoglycosylceramidase